MPTMHMMVPAIDTQTIVWFHKFDWRLSGVKYSQCITAPAPPQKRPELVVFKTTSPLLSVTYNIVPTPSSIAIRCSGMRPRTPNDH